MMVEYKELKNMKLGEIVKELFIINERKNLPTSTSFMDIKRESALYAELDRREEENYEKTNHSHPVPASQIRY